jgi:glyoxylase-like metal-dependent hydrolase (beta-lactamase superfamily II)
MDWEFMHGILEEMRDQLNLKSIDAMLITHMHGDHFLLGERLRQAYGAEMWTLDKIADTCAHPERYDYAAMIQSYGSGIDALPIDRRLKDGEVIEWEGLRLQVDWMPGQTEFGCCLWLDIDGKRVAFTGDNIFGYPPDPEQNGHEAVVARNSAILEEGYLYAAEYLKKLQPDILVGGHSFVMADPEPMIERYHQWAKEMIEAFQGLSPDPDYEYFFDPYWVKAYPYRLTLEGEKPSSIQLIIRNMRDRAVAHDIEIVTPEGISAEPRRVRTVVGGGARAGFSVHLSADQTASEGVNIVAFDISLDDRRIGQLFDMIVHVDAKADKGLVE